MLVSGLGVPGDLTQRAPSINRYGSPLVSLPVGLLYFSDQLLYF
jgi:hypothetical protein